MNRGLIMNSSHQINIEIYETFTHLVDVENIRTATETVLRLANQAHATLTIAITDDEEIQQLNRDYRGVDAPTDVLSFASQADEEGDQAFVLPPELAAEMAEYLGDIVIAYPYAARQAAHFGNSVAAELRLLAVHGTLHLLGYDHATPEEEAAMWARQEEALAPFGDHGLSQRTYDA